MSEITEKQINSATTMEDFNWLCETAYETQCSVEPEFNTSFDKVKNLVEAAKKEPHLYASIAYNEDGEKMGFFIGSVNQAALATNVVASDMLIYVSPVNRSLGSRVLVSMIYSFEAWAKRRGADTCILVKAGNRSKFNSKRFGYTLRQRHGIKHF